DGRELLVRARAVRFRPVDRALLVSFPDRRLHDRPRHAARSHGPARHAAPGTAAAAADRHAARTGVPDRARRDWIARERVSDRRPRLSPPCGPGRDSVVGPDHRPDRRRAVDHVAADADDRRLFGMTRITQLVIVSFVCIPCLRDVQAHSGPPFPIVTDQSAGAYKVTVWTDPDA